MSEDNKNDDWGMTMPEARLDDEAKKAIRDFTPKKEEAPSPPPADDWGMTAVNIPKDAIPQQNQPSAPPDFDKTNPNVNLPQNLSQQPPSSGQTPPSQDLDDWGVTQTNVNLPKEPPKDDWQMKQPVFRISSGETPSFDKSAPNINFNEPSEENLSGHTTPYYRLPENQEAPSAKIQQPLPEENRAEETVSAPQPAKSGNTKWILLLGGLFAFFLIVTGGLVGAYFLFFSGASSSSNISLSSSNKSDSTTSSNKSSDQSAPTSSSSSTSSNLPSSITYKSEMVLVPAGEFTMGSDSGDEESKPAHKVNLPAFYIDKYEVTNAQYKEFCDATSRSYPLNPSWNKNYFLERPNAPVLGVSFSDAKAYAEWAGKRLPTEQEWEKAASWNASSQTKFDFPWGNSFEKGKAIFGTNTTSEVGKFSGGASPSGAMDMAGNVFEWVDSYYQPYPNSTANNSEFGEKNRVARGGFFGSKTNDSLKTTKRTYLPPETASSETDSEIRTSPVGFRCAVSADDSRVQSFLK